MEQQAQPHIRASALLDSEYEVRQKIEAFWKAIRQGELIDIISFYADDIVAFDMMPPLKFDNVAQYKETAWKQCFTDVFKFPVVYDYKEDHFHLAGDSAIIYGEVHLIATFKQTGEKVENRLRNTLFFQKLDGKWKIVHEHNSVPLDMNMRGLMNLKPGSIQEFEKDNAISNSRH